MHNRGYYKVPSKIFCITVPKISVGESFTCAIISGIEEVGIRGGGGEYQDFPSKVFCLTVPKCFIGEHFGVSEKNPLSKIFMHRRGASRFCRNFLSHMTQTKSFVQETFCFPEIFWYQKKIMDKRGHITIFSRIIYVSQCRKHS